MKGIVVVSMIIEYRNRLHNYLKMEYSDEVFQCESHRKRTEASATAMEWNGLLSLTELFCWGAGSSVSIFIHIWLQMRFEWQRLLREVVIFTLHFDTGV